MGSKKHKRHKSDKKEAALETAGERAEKPLKLVLKVGGASTSLQAAATTNPPAPVAHSAAPSPHHSVAVPSEPSSVQHVPAVGAPVVGPQGFVSQAAVDTPTKPQVVAGDGGGDSWHSHEKHKKSKKKKKKKSSDKEKHDKKHKHHHHHHHHHHYHHHHHREYDRKDKKKRDHGSLHDGFECQDVDHEFVAKRALLDEGTPCERPFREPRACTLRKKAEKTPLQHLLYHLLKMLQKRDPNDFFSWPVNDIIAPGYSSIIQHPMDFSTMRKKIDDREYTNVMEFKSDLKLMCDNAMTYNRPDTIYYKAAKKMWHVGQKLLHREHLLSIARTLPYVSEISIHELGFSPSEADGTAGAHVHEAIYDDDRAPHETKPKVKQSATQDALDAGEDTMAADEILAQAREAAKAAADRLTLKKPNSKFGFLRQHDDGSTTLSILNPDCGSGPKEVKVTLDMLNGKLTHGTGSIAGFNEDPKNIVKPVHYTGYGAYCSYAPVYDTTFTNLTKEESDLVYSTYGDDLGLQYADSLMTFAKDCDYVTDMVDRILDVLTWGEHSKTTAVFNEKRQAQEEDQHRARSAGEYDTYTPGGFDPYEEGDGFGDAGHNAEIQEKLDATAELLKSLTRVQNERLSRTPPVHLSHVQGPTKEEKQIAEKVTSHLTELTSQVPPSAVVDMESVRGAMGITVQPVRSLSAEDFSVALTSTSSLGPSPLPSDPEDASSQDGAKATKEVDDDLDSDLHAFLRTGAAIPPISSPLPN